MPFAPKRQSVGLLLLLVLLQASCSRQSAREADRIATPQGADLRFSGLYSLEESVSERRSDSFADIVVVDQHGSSHLFVSDLVRDKICFIAFFYTKCEESCPETIAKMEQLRQRLSSVRTPKAPVFIAITLDPTNDTTTELKDFVSSHHLDDSDSPSRWYFCTGAPIDIERLRKSLGVFELDANLDQDRSQHAALITFGNDSTDRWTALPSGLPLEHLEKAAYRFMGTTIEERFAPLQSLQSVPDSSLCPPLSRPSEDSLPINSN